MTLEEAVKEGESKRITHPLIYPKWYTRCTNGDWHVSTGARLTESDFHHILEMMKKITNAFNEGWYTIR